MSRRAEDDIAGCLGGLLGLLFLGGIFANERMKTPPEDKLKELNLNIEWGETVEATACPQCKTENEKLREHCFNCGHHITTLIVAPDKPALSGCQILVIIVVVIILINFLSFFLSSA